MDRYTKTDCIGGDCADSFTGLEPVSPLVRLSCLKQRPIPLKQDSFASFIILYVGLRANRHYGCFSTFVRRLAMLVIVQIARTAEACVWAAFFVIWD